MTPVPLELPLRPAEAAELANLIFDHAEGKPLSDEVRNRLTARAAVLKLESLAPFFGSLERDPVHRSVYYLAVDGECGPLLLHIAFAAAPTSSIYYKPLLIGRMRRPNGSEMVINAIPFGPGDRQNVETFAARINSAFYPQPQGARTTVTVEQGYPAAFSAFRTIQKRTGKNFAAFSGDYHAAMWAAIRAGWRIPYTVATDVFADPSGHEGFSRYTLAVPPTTEGIEQAEKTYQQIRSARAASKISRSFDVEWDVEWDAAGSPSPQSLRTLLEDARQHSRLPQLVDAGALGDDNLEALAATAQQFQVTLSFRYRGEPAETVRAISRAMAGRLNYRVPGAEELQFVAEQLL